MKFLVYLVGNISSGKSSLLNAAFPILSQNLKIIKPDEIRALHRSKIEADNAIIENVLSSEIALLECTATSQWYKKIRNDWTGKSVHIFIDTPLEVCYQRHILRISEGYQLPEMHYSKSILNAMNDISAIHMQMQFKNVINGKISIQENTIKLAKMLRFLEYEF